MRRTLPNVQAMHICQECSMRAGTEEVGRAALNAAGRTVPGTGPE
jgi:hypothetical protein